MSQNRLSALVDILQRAVLRGGVEVLISRRENSVEASYKDARELVTTADKRSDAAILSLLQSEVPAVDPEISFRLEESGTHGLFNEKWLGVDPLDGTNHFAAGGTLYSVQAHYAEHGAPLVGVILQPEVYLPLSEQEACVGRLVWAIRGGGAFVARTELRKDELRMYPARRLERQVVPETKTYVTCAPLSTKMNEEEAMRVRRVWESGLISVTTGAGGAGANALMTVFGGQHVYANFGAGEDLDLMPPQVIAEEAGVTVWDRERKSPRWTDRKQPVVFAPSPAIAEKFLSAAGL